MLATSRLLQGALAQLIADSATEHHLRIARRRHRDRRRALAAALRERGIDISGDGDGLTLWVPVDDESHTRNRLAAQGITVGLGGDCQVEYTGAQHIWIGTGALPDRPQAIEDLASILAKAARSPRTGLSTVS